MGRLQNRGVEPRGRVSPRPIHKLAAGALLGGALALGCGSAAPVVKPDMHRVQPSQAGVVAVPVQEPEGQKALPPELAALPKVSLEKIRRLDKESEAYRTGDVDLRVLYQATLITELPDGEGKISAIAKICSVPGCNSTAEVRVPDKAVLISVKGEPHSVINLAPLEGRYKVVNGKELRYVKILAEHETDPEWGKAVTFYFVPVETPNGEIRGGVPATGVSYFISKPKKMFDGGLLVARR